MRALVLETIRTFINTVICILIARAGVELQSEPLIWIAGLMWISKLVAMTERRTTWKATRKKVFYKEKYRGENNG